MTARARAEAGGRRLTLAKGLRFRCRRCGDCCREFPVPLSAAEVERYEGRDWSSVLEGPTPPVVTTVRRGREVVRYLARKRDGTCLFLAPDDRCRIHAAFGEADKPLACRIFPFTFVEGEGPEGRPVASAQFSCSSIAAGDGAPLAQQRKDLQALHTELATLATAREAGAPAPVPFGGGLAYARDELELVLDLLVAELEDLGRPFPQRLLAAAKFLELVAASRFPWLTTPSARKAVTSFAQGVREQVRRDLLRAPPAPGPLPQRLLFRLLLAFAARRDSAALLTAGGLRRGSRRISNLLAGMAFVAGTGVVQPVGRDRRVVLGEVRRRAPRADLASPEADGALTRYLVAKLSGRFLLDEGFAVRAALPALGLLLRQVPIVALFSRAACLARGGDALTRDDWAAGLRTADWGFGRVPWDAGLLGGLRGRLLSDVGAPFALLPWCAGEPEREGGAGA